VEIDDDFGIVGVVTAVVVVAILRALAATVRLVEGDEGDLVFLMSFKDTSRRRGLRGGCLPLVLANDKLSNRAKPHPERNIPPVLLEHLPTMNTPGTTGSGWPVRAVSIQGIFRKQNARAQAYPKDRVGRVEAFESANIAGKSRHCYEQIEGYSVFAEEVEGGGEQRREKLVLNSFPSIHTEFIPGGVLLWPVA